MNYSHNSNKKNWTPLACMTPTFLNLPASLKMYQHYFLPKEIPREICDVVIVRQSLLQHHPTIVPNVRRNWFNLTRKALPFKKLTDPIYTDKRYAHSCKKKHLFCQPKRKQLCLWHPRNNPGT